ncbi:effector-associated constant component EACC1 [Streptomyces clavifer]|uniref:effector-associated constant component EACC1 n=1 Tax=Streptomyces clavifer TaxID=68188 RepID=UPI0033C31119
MRLVVTVRGEMGSDDGVADLGTWLKDVPQLRGRVDRAERDGGPPGTMGPAMDALVAVLEPGGVAAVFVGAVVAWLQTRRSSYTISVTRPDGTRISLSSRQARALSPQDAADLAERLARPPADGGGRADPQDVVVREESQDGNPPGSPTT